MLNLVFGGGQALFTAVTAFMEQILCPRGYTDVSFPHMDSIKALKALLETQFWMHVYTVKQEILIDYLKDV